MHSDAITFTGAGSVGDKHAANGKALTLGTLALGGSAAANYTLTGSAATTDITRATLSLTTSDVTKTYDGGLTALGTAVATGGTQLFSTDTASAGTFAFTDKNFGLSNKSVTTSGATVNDGNSGNNYNVSYVNNTGSSINKAALTATANNDSKVAGSPAYSGGNGVSYSGLVAGDTVATVVTGMTSYSGTSQGATALGSYVITPGGLTAASNNYTLGFANGVLNITPAVAPPVGVPVTATSNNASGPLVAALGSTALVPAYSGELQSVAGLGGSSGLTNASGGAGLQAQILNDTADGTGATSGLINLNITDTVIDR